MERIKKLLEPNEEILGAFYPKKRIPFNKRDWIKIPFSIAWASVLILTYMIYEKVWVKTFISELVYVIMFITAFQFVVGRFVKLWMKTVFQIYIITDKRVIFYSKISHKANSLYYINFPEMNLRTNKNDYGHIIFGKPQTLFGTKGVNFSENKYVFYNLKEVSKVYKLICQLVER